MTDQEACEDRPQRSQVGLWYRVFIELRNRVGNMEYEDGGAIGYDLWRTPAWRIMIAEECGRIAGRSPGVVWRKLLERLAIIEKLATHDDGDIPF